MKVASSLFALPTAHSSLEAVAAAVGAASASVVVEGLILWTRQAKLGVQNVHKCTSAKNFRVECVTCPQPPPSRLLLRLPPLLYTCFRWQQRCGRLKAQLAKGFHARLSSQPLSSSSRNSCQSRAEDGLRELWLPSQFTGVSWFGLVWHCIMICFERRLYAVLVRWFLFFPFV